MPTFRDAQTGHWARLDPETLASPRGFAENPGLVWGWYMSRLDGVAGKPIIEVNHEPTPITRIAEVCLRGPSGVTLPRLLRCLEETS